MLPVLVPTLYRSGTQNARLLLVPRVAARKLGIRRKTRVMMITAIMTMTNVVDCQIMGNDAYEGDRKLNPREGHGNEWLI